MKLAYSVSILEADRVPFGLHLGWGHRGQHEEGLERMHRDLGCRPSDSGLRTACDRDVSRMIRFAASPEQDLAVLSLDSADLSRRKPSRLIEWSKTVLDSHAADLGDEIHLRFAVHRACWDGDSFLVRVSGAKAAAALELLSLQFQAEDLALSYSSPFDTFEVDKSNPVSSLGHGLGLFSPGLMPTAWRDALARHQSASKAWLPQDDLRPSFNEGALRDILQQTPAERARSARMTARMKDRRQNVLGEQR